MPRLAGKLETITNTPSGVREVLLRAARTRTNGKTVIVDEPVRVIVNESGEFTATIAPGAAVLMLVGADFMARESIPLLVAEGMTTIAEAMDASKDFTPEVHDKLAELAAEVARGVKSTGEAVKSVAADREKVEAAAKSVEDSSSAVKAAEASVSSTWQQLKAKLEAWKPQAEQLETWQPQYLWLKENAASGFTKIAELMQDAAAGVRGELVGLVEQAKTAQTTAGQHSLKAQAAAKDAESVANRVVDAAIAKLKGNAPAKLDTLGKLAERVESGGTLENEILQKLSKMADSDTVKQLKSRLDSLSIDAVKGLSQTLAGKANSSHAHRMSDITGLEDLANNCSRLEGRVSSLITQVSSKADSSEIADMATKHDVQQLQATVNAAPKIKVVSQMPTHPDNQTIYLVR
ncbi:hypothetical protein FRC0095_01479 [Corynebacterium diphtheriae]|nr:hypothetical protein FRC0095_01479 [Corynebacterium diphtheriae]CAB0803366.1 hypothetical protein FRC0201_01417 [Corynebacterium diphtheriae]CAB0850047.1 hypothetical protein FRC0326_01489 [Corynebacterium diphtheriae]CAB0881879.1 hypothetical protein FRC0408_01389 [Corynebacterium diphtheriae]CAB0909797.1 hypothetical protein FRC0409_01577 [Corynebacterium diphtheriae]